MIRFRGGIGVNAEPGREGAEKEVVEIITIKEVSRQGLPIQLEQPSHIASWV